MLPFSEDAPGGHLGGPNEQVLKPDCDIGRILTRATAVASIVRGWRNAKCDADGGSHAAEREGDGRGKRGTRSRPCE
jgi:hypothetical protein